MKAAVDEPLLGEAKYQVPSTLQLRLGRRKLVVIVLFNEITSIIKNPCNSGLHSNK